MKEAIFGFISGCLCSAVLVAHLATSAFKDYESKAVELGAAHWVVDQKTGETTFTWKEQP